MGSNLAKTPLTAVCYAAFLNLFVVFVPFSQGYLESIEEFAMPMAGYLWLLLLGLWVSLGIALVFSAAAKKDAKLVGLVLVTYLAGQWFAPMLPRLFFPEPSGVLSGADGWLQFALGALCTVLLLVLAALLFQAGEPEQPPAGTPQVSFKIRPWILLVLLVALPLVFCIAFLILWYLFSWKVDAVRIYYGFVQEGEELLAVADNGFIATMINMLLGYAKMVPMSLALGWLYELATLPLLLLYPGKRVMYLVTTILLYGTLPVALLIPSAVMPDAVRSAEMLQWAVLLGGYGVAVGALMPLALRRLETAPPPRQEGQPIQGQGAVRRPVAGQRPAARPVGR